MIIMVVLVEALKLLVFLTGSEGPRAWPGLTSYRAVIDEVPWMCPHPGLPRLSFYMVWG